MMTNNQNPNSQRPLVGRTVLVTRPLAQSQEMAALLEGLGANVICCPMIETIAPQNWDEVDGAIERLAGYDYIVFTSANGVNFFFRRLEEKRHIKLSEQTGAVICAIGQATAEALELNHARAGLIARQARAEGLLAAILEAVGDRDRLQGLRFLIPRAKVARELLPDELRRLGAQVDVVEVYQTVSAGESREPLIERLSKREIDVMTFTSPSTVEHFVTLVGKEQLAELMVGVYAACIGSITAAAAKAHGFKNVIEPTVSTTTGLVEAITAIYQK
jgi:uroporphyrinogen III methyltransferase/synthase